MNAIEQMLRKKAEVAQAIDDHRRLGRAIARLDDVGHALEERARVWRAFTETFDR